MAADTKTVKRGGLSSRRRKKAIVNVICFILLAAASLTVIMPLWFMISTALKSMDEIFTYPITWYPHEPIWSNFKDAWASAEFSRWFLNSVFVAAFAILGGVLANSLVAYGFARFKFRGKSILFAAMLLSMMLPAQVLMIPQYLWYQKLGWVGSYMPLTVPYFFAIQGFFVYLISNFISGIPTELDEAAKIDGCSYAGIFTRIMLPLIKPALVTACIFSFMWRWDDFLSALLYVSKSSMYPVSLALKLFCDPGSSSDYGAMFAMATLSILPSILIFLFFQKYLVEGISTSGLKG